MKLVNGWEQSIRIQLEIASIVPGDPIFPSNDTDTEDAVEVELIVEDPEDADMIEIEVEIMKADPGDEEEIELDETVVEEEEMAKNPVAAQPDLEQFRSESDRKIHWNSIGKWSKIPSS